MKKENVYVASDGKKFDTEKECNNYEDVCNAIKTLDNYCMKTNCDKCPFFNSSESRCYLIKGYTTSGWFWL